MIRPLLFSLLATTALATAPVRADPAADARFIIDATVTDEAMSGVLSAMGPVLFAAMESELRNKGITLSDTETFANILIEEFMAGYLDAMRSEMAAIYLEEFYPEEPRRHRRLLRRARRPGDGGQDRDPRPAQRRGRRPGRPAGGA
ncbi:MAG: hypothetical protein R3D80_09585 [Paracoccaceae bacterium]